MVADRVCVSQRPRQLLARDGLRLASLVAGIFFVESRIIRVLRTESFDIQYGEMREAPGSGPTDAQRSNVRSERAGPAKSRDQSLPS